MNSGSPQDGVFVFHITLLGQWWVHGGWAGKLVGLYISVLIRLRDTYYFADFAE